MLAYLSQYPLANGAALGDGLNLGSYSFSSPNPQNLNTSIVRLDWDPVPHHQLFVRGNLQDDTTDDPIQFPGQPATYVIRDNSKGIGAGDTWEITNNLVNDFRYGYIRQGYSQAGSGCGAYVYWFRTLSTLTPDTCSTIVHVPGTELYRQRQLDSWKPHHLLWRRPSSDHQLFQYRCHLLRLRRWQHSMAEHGGGAIAGTGRQSRSRRFRPASRRLRRRHHL